MDNLSKICFKCKATLDLSSFSKETKRKDGLSPRCKACKKIYNKQTERRRDIRDEAIRATGGISLRYVQDRVSLYKSRAKSKNYPFDLDADYLINLWKNQNGKCYYTNREMNIIHLAFNFWSPSLDRLDPDKGYVKGNVAWALHGVNCFKQELTLSQFLDFVNSVEWPKNV
jgi:hypothetical protein